MNSDTPARLIRPADLARNIAAFEQCLSRFPLGSIKTALDIRYGLGGWAKALTLWASWDLTIYGLEADRITYEDSCVPSCAKVLNRAFHVAIPESWPKKFDLLCADFNNLTMLKATDLVVALEVANPRFLIFTDVACSKLHLNHKSYGMKKPDLDLYFKKFQASVLFEWELVHIARLHHHAATTAWRRK